MKNEIGGQWKAIRTGKGHEPPLDDHLTPWFRPGHNSATWDNISTVTGRRPDSTHPLIWAVCDLLADGTPRDVQLQLHPKTLRAYLNGLLVADRLVFHAPGKVRIGSGTILPGPNRVAVVLDGQQSLDGPPAVFGMTAPSEIINRDSPAGSFWAPPGVYVWDPWPARNGPARQMFFLHASRAVFNPTQRHQVANIGRATAGGAWWNWHYDGGMFIAGAPGAWDDKRIVTSSIIKRKNQWFMPYTGDGAAIGQATGVAVSDDLENWRRLSPEPAVTPDGKIYRTRYPWADGFILERKKQEDYLLLVKAEALESLGPDCGPGCIGAARTSDFAHWELLPPFYYPGDFKHIEVPRLYFMQDKWVLLFSTMPQLFAPAGIRRLEKQGEKPQMGDYYVVADSLEGPWTPPRKLRGPGGRILSYGTNFMQEPDGWTAVWWDTSRMALSRPHRVDFDGESLVVS